MQISLKCLNCGAALTIREGVDQMGCGYCGVVQQVQREGGGVWLSLEKAISELKQSNDRAAAEMTLRRLREEREDFRRQLEEVQTRAAETSNESTRSFSWVALTASFGIAAVLIAMRFFQKDSEESFGLGSQFLFAVIALIMISAVIAGVTRYRAQSIRDDAEADVAVLEGQIADLDRDIEDHRRRVSDND